MKGEYISLIAGIFFHPMQAFQTIRRYRRDIRLVIPVCIIFLAAILYVICVSCFHFPLAILDLRNSNFLLEVLKFLVLVVTWIIAGYIITAINDGEMTFKEFTMATAYSLFPLVVFMPLFALLSQLLSANGAGLFNTLIAIVIGWCVLLMILNFSVLNSYTLGQTVKLLLITVASIVVIWFIVFVVYAMASQMIGFVKSVIDEVTMLIQYGR